MTQLHISCLKVTINPNDKACITASIKKEMKLRTKLYKRSFKVSSEYNVNAYKKEFS